MNPIRNKVAIVAAADTPVGVVPNMTASQLYLNAIRLATSQIGITKDDIDGIAMTEPRTERLPSEKLAEYIQIFPKWVTKCAGGPDIINGLNHAALAIMAGVCNTAVIVSADSMASGFGRNKTVEAFSQFGDVQFEQPYGLTVPGYHSLVAAAHQKRYGTSEEQRAAVAVACRKHACLHPGAQMRKPITVADVLASKMIASPLHMLDCSLISDGGAAIIMTTVERARDYPTKPVYFQAFGEGYSHENISQMEDLTGSVGCKMAGERAFTMAGLKPKDIDVAGIYDCFTPTVIVELEELGFCPKGEGGRFVEGGRIELGGELPINTHGGLLSHCHPGGPGSMFHVTEVIRQLRGECGARQVKDAKVGLVHGQHGVLSSQSTIIMSNEPL